MNSSYSSYGYDHNVSKKSAVYLVEEFLDFSGDLDMCDIFKFRTRVFPDLNNSGHRERLYSATLSHNKLEMKCHVYYKDTPKQLIVALKDKLEKAKAAYSGDSLEDAKEAIVKIEKQLDTIKDDLKGSEGEFDDYQLSFDLSGVNIYEVFNSCPDWLCTDLVAYVFPRMSKEFLDDISTKLNQLKETNCVQVTQDTLDEVRNSFALSKVLCMSNDKCMLFKGEDNEG